MKLNPCEKYFSNVTGKLNPHKKYFFILNREIKMFFLGHGKSITIFFCPISDIVKQRKRCIFNKFYVHILVDNNNFNHSTSFFSARAAKQLRISREQPVIFAFFMFGSTTETSCETDAKASSNNEPIMIACSGPDISRSLLLSRKKCLSLKINTS